MDNSSATPQTQAERVILKNKNTMKKYIIPALRVADIQNEVILAGSPEAQFGETPITDGSGIGARDRDLFDWNTDEE